jgi:hypothetical protein
MPLLIKLPRKETEVVLTGGLGATSAYLALFGKSITSTEAALLMLAAVVHFYFFIKVIRNEVVLYGWSLQSTLWGIPGLYSAWMIFREWLI